MVLVWGSVSPEAGAFEFFGLSVSNFVAKTVYVSGLFVIVFLAGAVQLSGCCAAWVPFEEPILIAAAPAHGHGAGDAHGGAGDHGHGGQHRFRPPPVGLLRQPPLRRSPPLRPPSVLPT